MVRPALLLLTAAALHAGNISIGAGYTDALLQYRVHDPSRHLEAVLRFPVEAAVGRVGYEKKIGDDLLLRFALTHHLGGRTPVGSDRDWRDGELIVASESQTRLKRYRGVDFTLQKPLLEGISAGVELFYEGWQLSWYDTQQRDLVDGSGERIGGETVRFTQELGGTRLFLKFGERFRSWAWDLKMGIEADRHFSRDEHLERGFYTEGEDWMVGSRLGFGVQFCRDARSSLRIDTEYRLLKGVGEMLFYYDYGPRYMTLPATYTTRAASVMLHYNYHF